MLFQTLMPIKAAYGDPFGKCLLVIQYFTDQPLPEFLSPGVSLLHQLEQHVR